MPKFAALDIGSNSIRMAVAELDHSPNPSARPFCRILATEREVVRLGESVFREGRLSFAAIAAARRTLSRMAEIYRQFDVESVRAVATSAVRDARNQDEFLGPASQSAGAPVEIISGIEESRLIHMGVQLRWPHPNERILIVDVGGGSAELILSEAGQIRASFSKPLGAVRLQQMFLRNDPPTTAELRSMDRYIEEKLAPALRGIGGRTLHRVIATSATAASVVGAANRIERSERDRADRLSATAAQVRKLYEAASIRDLEGRQRMPGVGPRRAEVLVPGMAVLRQVLEGSRQPALYYSVAGVRDGLLADLLERHSSSRASLLNREQHAAVENLARRYGIDFEHVRRIAALAHELFIELRPLHGLTEHAGVLLYAAAILMDVGHYVSDSRHHQHSYYLVLNSPLPGFLDNERSVIASLCLYHRRSAPAAEDLNLQIISETDRQSVRLLAPLLRIADALVSSRNPVRGVRCEISDSDVCLMLATEADIDLEQWAIQQVEEPFHQVYGRRLAVSRVLPATGSKEHRAGPAKARAF